MDAYYYVSRLLSASLFLSLLLSRKLLRTNVLLTCSSRSPLYFLQAVLLEYAEIQRGWKLADGGGKVVDVEPRAFDGFAEDQD